MSQHCCEHTPAAAHTLQNPTRYRRILWIALAINAAMFGVEIAAGMTSGSLALLADAIDFAGDALNYGVSIAVLTAAVTWRARAAMVKALCMAGFGLLVLGQAVWNVRHGGVPDAATMGVIGFVALAANVAVAAMLYAFREGDANMRSVWLCTRNDAIGNIAVMLAALGVLGTGSQWPDLMVAIGMSALALQGGWQVWRQARAELHESSPGARSAL